MWFPVNLIFVGMIWTSFYALKSMGVAMVTILKNLTNLIIIIGDYYFFGRTYSLSLWGSLFVSNLRRINPLP
jgi:GDP-mannose transporter